MTTQPVKDVTTYNKSSSLSTLYLINNTLDFLHATAHSHGKALHPSCASIVPRLMKIESCGLHCEVAQTL